MWMIKREYRDKSGKPIEITERIPAHNDVCTEITESFRVTLLQALAESSDDDSDMTVTVAFVGQRKAV